MRHVIKTFCRVDRLTLKHGELFIERKGLGRRRGGSETIGGKRRDTDTLDEKI